MINNRLHTNCFLFNSFNSFELNMDVLPNVNYLFEMYKTNKTSIKIILLALSWLSVMCTGLISPALPSMVRHYSYLPDPKLMVMLVVTVPQISICITSMLAVFIMRMFNKISILACSVLIYAIAGISCFWCENIIYIIVLRAILGCAVAMVLSSSSVLIANIFDNQEREMTVSLQTTFMSFGTIINTLISGVLSDIDWRYNFLLYSVAIVFVPFILIFLSKIPKKHVQKTGEKNGHVLRISKNHAPQNNYIICLILLIATLNIMMYYMIPLQLPFLLSDLSSMNAKKISVAIAVETLASAMFALTYKKVRRYLEFDVLSSIVLLLMGCCYFVITMFFSYSSVVLVMLVYGFCMGMMMPNLTIWTLNVTHPKNRGFVLSSMYTAVYMGKFSSSFWIKYIHKSHSIRDTYFYSAIVLVTFAVLSLFLSRLLSSKAQKDRLKRVRRVRMKYASRSQIKPIRWLAQKKVL